MKIGFYNYYNAYNNNQMFKSSFSPIGDDLMFPMVYFYHYAQSRGIELSTIDTESLDNYDAIVFLDFPTFRNKYFKELVKKKKEQLFLIICESKLIRPDNWDIKNHVYFKKIFTWDDDLVDNKKYIKLNIVQKIPDSIDFDLNYSYKKLCTLIASNKMYPGPNELYSERVNAIRWFERFHPDEFDLYGIGWDLYAFSGVLHKLNNFPVLRKLMDPKFSTYKGSVNRKHEILKKYKFCICYENVNNAKGYVTEKIFDCFFAGCVPIYLGAPNITDIIPEETFIDRRNFNTYDELYNFITNIPEMEYLHYLKAIAEYIRSEKILQFGGEKFSYSIINEILSG